MNNNKQTGKQANGESDIITKKGFLISIPQGKKQNEGSSSINFAKPSRKAGEHDGEKKNFDDSKKAGGKKKFDKKRGSSKSNAPQADVKKEQNGLQGDNRQKGENRNENRNENKNENKNENRNDRVGKSRNDRNRHGKNKHRGRVEERQNLDAKADSHDGQKALHGDKNERRDLKQNHGGHNHQGHGKNDKSRRDGRDKEARMAPLSALSSDIASYAKHKSEAEQAASAFSELSLEEKYKNAKPLSQQIAEQEMRQKGIKIPYGNEEPKQEEKQEIVGVRFREAGKVYYFDPDGKVVPFGTPVIVETARGSEYGFIAISNRKIPVASLSAPLKKLERIATTADTQKHVYNKDMEKDAEVIFKEKVEKLGLPMNLIYVEYTFDNSRLLFYFTAETRIDFRELVKELASVFRTRIELRQIGVRDEAKTIGGLGVCGRATCCNTFLGDFAQVSIKMAKDQNLSLNAAKISGACGKLMCCLRYEDKVYEEENARTPKVGSVVETVEGKGVVTEARPLKGIVIVSLENSPDAPPKPFYRDEVTVVGFNKSMAKNGDEDESELKHLEN